ncbi:MAG: hypothetical protein ACFFER_14250, partial [Candidatus Thorarchaeota archaeon]
NTSGSVIIEKTHFVDMEVGINVNNYVSMINITRNVFYHIDGPQITNNMAMDIGTSQAGATIIIRNNSLLNGSYSYIHNHASTYTEIVYNLFNMRFEIASANGIAEFNCFNASINTLQQSHGIVFDYNFYASYNGTDLDLDGIGDVPFTSNGTFDDHPLMSWDEYIPIPSINSPPDVVQDFDTVGNSIVWTPWAFFPHLWELYRNGTLVKSGMWNNSFETIEHYLDGLELGKYNFTLLVFDASGNYASDTVMVSVVDTAEPTNTTTTQPTTATATPTSPEPPGDIEPLVTLFIIAGLGGAALVAILIAYLRRKSG